jgi:hypothetical protein
MSDTTSGDDTLGGGFDQTNDMVGGLEGQSDGTTQGENASAAEREDGGDVLDEGRDDPTFGGATHIGADQPQDDRPLEDGGGVA